MKHFARLTTHLASALLMSASLFANLNGAQPVVAAPQAPEATPVVGGTSYGGATQITPGTEYSSSLSTSTTDDFFYFDVTPGQIATVVFTSTVNWSGAGFFYLFDQLHVNSIGQKSVYGPEVNDQMIHVGNSTTPTRYYFRIQAQNETKECLFKVTLANQNDVGVSGDVGNTSATARVITPTVGTSLSFIGQMGGYDTDDWYRVFVAPGQRISVTARILDYGADTRGFVALHDAADAARQIAYKEIDSPDLEPHTNEYMSNSTTPAAYLIRMFMVSNAALGVPLRYQVDVLVTDQTDGGPVGDAGDIAGTARVITPTLGVMTSYSGTIGQNDANDWFRINAVSGMRISVTTTILDFGNDTNAFASFYDAASTANAIFIKTFNSANAPQSVSYMSNNTTPAAYLIRIDSGGTPAGKSATYRFDVLAEQQTDGNRPGDAGEDFDTARLISPTLNAQTNLLGSADDDDFYKIDLPIDPVTGAGANVPFKMLIAPVPWPANSTGSLDITVYNASRTQVGQTQRIVAPTTEAASIDLTNCDLCYVKIHDNSSGLPQLQYSFKLLAPFFIFVPIARK